MENENIENCIKNEAHAQLMNELEKGKKSGYMTEEVFFEKVDNNE